ncbi:hypothetical protein ACFQRL_09645 [Microbacterium fluvii]|uniref:Uncharacterized protein n=1 Tax=Microbacterium fluvii TaxID=415215 RepID=A0ABW2HHM0_9MICO|nr:hypothetical protein [Microbacterium fluvii]MCU4672853.1 hypothetical protein [Microbacterium fluvii]
MQLSSTGRVVFWAQWVLAVFLPFFVFTGRGFVGAELGWMAVLGILYGAILIVALLVPPIVGLFDVTARRVRSVREAYAAITGVLWLALVVAALSIPDSGDGGHLDSALTAWTGMSYETSVIVFAIAFAVAVLAWIAAIVAAALGVARSRRGA